MLDLVLQTIFDDVIFTPYQEQISVNPVKDKRRGMFIIKRSIKTSLIYRSNISAFMSLALYQALSVGGHQSAIVMSLLDHGAEDDFKMCDVKDCKMSAQEPDPSCNSHEAIHFFKKSIVAWANPDSMGIPKTDERYNRWNEEYLSFQKGRELTRALIE